MVQEFIAQYADTIIFAVIAAVAGFVGKRVNEFLKYKHLDGYVSTAVKYAEQYLASEGGQAKYKKVLDMVGREAQRIGLKSLTGDKLAAYIEAAVHDMNIDQAAYASVSSQEAVPTTEQEAEPKSGTADEVAAAAQSASQAAEMAAADAAKKVGDITIGELKKLIAK